MTAADHQDPATSTELVRILAGAQGLFDRVGALALAGATQGSEADIDAGLPLGHHVGFLASGYLTTGVEHLVMWDQLLTVAAVQPIAVHMTLIRSAMECAVMSRWLLESGDSAERIRRGVAVLLKSYRNKGDFDRDFGIADKYVLPAKGGAVRAAELLAMRNDAGIEIRKVPEMTELFGGYASQGPGPGRSVYRLLSAYAHGTQWKDLTVSAEVAVGAASIRGGKVMRITADDRLSLTMTKVGMRAVVASFNRLEQYYGRAAE